MAERIESLVRSQQHLLHYVSHELRTPLTRMQLAISLARSDATPETLQVRSMVETARTLNPGVQIVVRSHNVEEAELLEKEGAGTVFVGESELANAMVRHVLQLVNPAPGPSH